MNNRIRTGLLAALLVLPGGASAQGLIHAKQIIFGMDCAPCAYGVEKGLKGLPGVEAVKVSLNDGYAEVTLAPGSATSLSDIRRVILKSGFTPKDAQIQIEGQLHLSPQPGLSTPSGVYALTFDRGFKPASSLEGRKVAVRGWVAGNPVEVRVETLEADGRP